jgi:hypothetical protein
MRGMLVRLTNPMPPDMLRGLFLKTSPRHRPVAKNG